ncbi:ATP-binding protein [Nocardioides sp. SYSU DS0651]|uniref:ATP-binding protein n=1 Tax=Nocardioides sp. SYSU DS0651 TaxID=3415955 RepID=UPI003F4B6963
MAGTAPGVAARRRFPAHPSSVGQARALLREALSEPAHEPLLDDAQLLVSEVVTNALVHAGTPIDLAVSVQGATLRVEVSDGAAHLPVRRDYAAMAGTGRGLQLLDALGDRWGVDPTHDGKTVWFELGPAGADQGERREVAEPASAERVNGVAAPDDTVTVTLRNVPLLLHSAWSQHAESVLREYLLFTLDDVDAVDTIEAHAAAQEAMALLVEGVPAPRLGDRPEELLADAIEPLVTQDEVLLAVPRTAVPHFALLDQTMEAAWQLASAGRFLTPPIQPEMRALRHWMCGEVTRQAAGEPATPWSTPGPTPPEALTTAPDFGVVANSGRPLVATDAWNGIVAVSRPALDLLGYDDADELVGQRLLAIIPPRFHQAHLAGFTLHLSMGRSTLLDRPVTVPVLRRDGTETEVELTVRADQTSGGEQMFVGELRA